ncbi:MAG: right-handed parallel beta-helix repeat-containing protein [Acidobacteriia bacterium]|nr:right-handed parallel beta-helix repeat-containing protein [Terriglobia bacterium]
MNTGRQYDRRQLHSKRLAVLAFLLALAAAPLAALENFRTIDYPGATSTQVNGINDAGDTVGFYVDAAQKTHGFLLKQGKFTSLDFTGATATQGRAINNVGDIAGYYTYDDGLQHSFLYSGGKFTKIDVPGANYTGAIGLNDNGEVVGHTQFPGESMKGFLWKQGQYSTYTYPEPNTMGCGFGINANGDIVGHWRDTAGTIRGYVLRKGRFVSFEFPGAKGTMIDAGEISLSGDVVGPYTGADGVNYGFLYSRGTFTTIAVPGALATQARAINNSNDIAGFFKDSTNAFHGFVGRASRPAPGRLLTVDDDGADCPNSLRTIQEAVAQAPGGATILVCPGTYHHTVEITGHEKDGLKLIAVGNQNEVILQGDYTEHDGFHLKDVSSVLIRGFTVRDFGDQATTATVWGSGAQIFLENAHYNTIEFNQVIDGDMVGIRLQDAGHNLVRHNAVLIERSNLANCGMHIAGAGTVDNQFLQNLLVGNLMAGIMMSGAGPGNFIGDNTIVHNGRFGITNGATNGTTIAGNRISYNGGPWGVTPYPADVAGLGRGISVTASDGVVVFDNRVRGNSEVDIFWDNAGANKFDSNACDSSNPAGACGPSTQK